MNRAAPMPSLRKGGVASYSLTAFNTKLENQIFFFRPVRHRLARPQLPNTSADDCALRSWLSRRPSTMAANQNTSGKSVGLKIAVFKWAAPTRSCTVVLCGLQPGRPRWPLTPDINQPDIWLFWGPFFPGSPVGCDDVMEIPAGQPPSSDLLESTLWCWLGHSVSFIDAMLKWSTEIGLLQKAKTSLNRGNGPHVLTCCEQFAVDDVLPLLKYVL